MYVMRYILAAVLSVIPITWAMIEYFPNRAFMDSIMMVFGAGAAGLVVATALALYTEDQLPERYKSYLMGLFLIAIFVPTVFASAAFVHRSVTTWSGGEVHYHADYEVVVQDENGGYEQLDLIDPGRFCEGTGHESSYMCELNDRTGAVEFHEHDDRRIHLEGSFRDREDATLGAFFRTFGGELTNDQLIYPTNDRVWNISNTEDRTLKIIMKRGVGGTRGYCILGEGYGEDTCINSPRHTDSMAGQQATSPDEYVVSPWQQATNQTSPAPLDVVWIVYDSASAEQVMQDLAEDDAYKQFSIDKSSEGY